MSIYLSHYGLTGDPFHVTPDFSMLLLTQSHREALAAISYGLRDRKGFMVVTGEVGTGKTTVLRACLDQLPPRSTHIVYIFEPRLDTRDLYRTILDTMADIYDAIGETGPAAARLPLESQSVPLSLMQRDIQQALLSAHEAGLNVVLAVDEAQHMASETLESLRLLSNLETAKAKLLQIILIGQPELDTILRRHDMRQLEQRIAVRARIDPLSRRDSIRYIRHRLRVAGWRPEQELFTRPALWLLAWRARGIPRRLNIYCDNAMVNGYGSSADEEGAVSSIGFWTVVRSIGLMPQRGGWGAGRVLAAILLILALGVLAARLPIATWPARIGLAMTPPIRPIAAALPTTPARPASGPRGAAATARVLAPTRAAPQSAARLPPASSVLPRAEPVMPVATTASSQQGSAATAPAPTGVPRSSAAEPGGTAGPGEPQPAVAAQDWPVRRTVQTGDSLSSLCAQIYHECTRKDLRGVIDANSLPNPDHLIEGQVVVFPSRTAGE